jgi:hypothetical protein
MRNKLPLRPLCMLCFDYSVVANFQTTRPPRQGKATGIIEDRKKVLAHSFAINHLHITVVQ